MVEEVKKLLTEQQEVWKSLKSHVEKLEGEGKTMGKHWDEKMSSLNTRLDEIEAALKRPAQASAEGKAVGAQLSEQEVKHMDAFKNYFRTGEGAKELKALSSDNDTTGGYSLPRNVAAGIIKRLIEISPIRQYCEVVSISSGDSHEQPKEGAANFDCEWASERGTRNETNTGDLGMEKIPVHEMSAIPKITEKMLEDPAFDVEGWMFGRLADAFNQKEAVAFISGDGLGKPEGILSHSGVLSVNSGDASLLKADGLIALYYGLPQFYAKNGAWFMNRKSIQVIRTFKDSYGQYLWTPGFSSNLTSVQPDNILGRPYVECVDMPDIGSGTYPIIFGDLSRAYRIVDRVDIRVLRDPFSYKPYIGYYTRKRVGGQVVLAEAIRKQKVSS